MKCSECKKKNIKEDKLYRLEGQRARGYVCKKCRKKANYEEVLSYTERKYGKTKTKSNKVFA